jgi:hypothetical protein
MIKLEIMNGEFMKRTGNKKLKEGRRAIHSQRGSKEND